MTGRVKSMPVGKKFAYIRCEGREYFFHRDDFIGNWDDLVYLFNTNTEVKVSFESVESPKGPRAANVQLERIIHIGKEE